MMRARPRRSAGLLILLLCAYYGLLGLVVLAPEGIYSGDIGVQYVQAQALVDSGFRSLSLHYPGEFLDPGWHFFPIRPPFVLRAGEEIQAIFPPALAVLQGVCVALAGFHGLIVCSLVASGALLYLSRRLSPEEDAARVLIALGLASPLWFYAISGWQHAAAMALGTAAFVAAATGAGRASALHAGLWLGVGAALRDETILLLPGVAAALWLRWRAWRPLLLALAGTAAAVGGAAALDSLWFGRPVGAHLRHAVAVLHAAFESVDAPTADVPVLNPMTPRQRYETVVWYWLFGYGNDLAIAAFVAGLAGALALRWRLRSSAPLAIWLAAVVVLAGRDVWELVTAPKWLAGLHRVAPYLVFALLPAPPSGRGERLVSRIAPLTLAAYLLVALAGADTTGGKGLGPRLLLPLLPILAVAAVTRIGSYVRSASRADRWTGRAGMVLVAMALVMHVYGTTRAYYLRNRDDAKVVQGVAASPERIVVADDPYTAQLLFPLYYRKIILLAETPESAAALAAMMAAERVPAALLVSRRSDPAVALTALNRNRLERRGRMFITYWSR